VIAVVEDRVTDGTRIAQLLASELDGREDGPLDRVAVVNADPGVESTPEGAHAYDLSVDGSVVGAVSVVPEASHVELATGVADAGRVADNEDLDVATRTGTAGPVIHVGSGAAVKGAVEIVAAAIEDGG